MTPPQVSIPESAADQRRRFVNAYSILEEGIRQRAFPGAAFGVLTGGEIVAIDGIGSFTYEHNSLPVTASTVYDLASLTKVLATTSMAMLLYQRGELALDNSLDSYLPAFSAQQPREGARHQVTLRMLLAHSSGLPGYARLFDTCRESDALLEACLRLPLEAAPGTRTEYSDPGFILLGRALEKLAGETLDSFCAREIFGPLGMISTRFVPPKTWTSSIPPTEDDLHFRHRIVQGEVQDENCYVLGGVSGHAGLFSNALDPLRYGQCLLRQGYCGPADKQQLFTPATIQLFTARSSLPPGRGLGWDTPSPPSSSGRLFSQHSAGHLGYSGTSLWIDLDRELAVVLLTNRTWPFRESQAIRQFRPAFHDAILEGLGVAP